MKKNQNVLKLFQILKIQQKQIKNKNYINVLIVIEHSKGKHTQNMFLYVKEFFIIKMKLIIVKEVLQKQINQKKMIKE